MMMSLHAGNNNERFRGCSNHVHVTVRAHNTHNTVLQDITIHQHDRATHLADCSVSSRLAVRCSNTGKSPTD